jgi:hypothetical protein
MRSRARAHRTNRPGQLPPDGNSLRTKRAKLRTHMAKLTAQDVSGTRNEGSNRSPGQPPLKRGDPVAQRAHVAPTCASKCILLGNLDRITLGLQPPAHPLSLHALASSRQHVAGSGFAAAAGGWSDWVLAMTGKLPLPQFSSWGPVLPNTSALSNLKVRVADHWIPRFSLKKTA